MQRLINTAVLLSVLVVGTGGILAGPPQEQGGERPSGGDKALALPTCPVMDEPINFAMRVATKKGPAYFCCDDCMGKFQKKPRKYAAKIAAQRKALAGVSKVQVTCPVTGDTVDRETFAEYRGQKVYFSTKDSVSKFLNRPKKYSSALANSYTFQTKCPVSGKDIDPGAFGTLASGLKVYYCCPKCDKTFSSSPGEYLPNLAAQGFNIEQEDQGSRQDG